jgi:glycosyltransferase involved in cell wall biosynthesis
MPQISIITPVRNGLPFVQSCVDSVLSQDFQEWELLISDNASDDGTREYLTTLTDPRIRVFYQQQNLGINGNLNFLVQQAAAPICQFLCADDYFSDAQSLSYIVNLWANATDIGFIRANWSRAKARNAIEAFAIDSVPMRVEPAECDLFFFIFGCFAGNTSNISLRTHLYKKMGGLSKGVVTDFDFWTRTARETPFLLEESPLTYVRAHKGQASNYLNRHGEAISQQFAIVEELFGRLKKDFPVSQLRVHATVFYDAPQRWAAVRRLLFNGSRAYFDALAAATIDRPMFLHPVMRWAVFLLTGGGRWGKTLIARRLLERRRLPVGHVGVTP